MAKVIFSKTCQRNISISSDIHYMSNEFYIVFYAPRNFIVHAPSSQTVKIIDDNGVNKGSFKITLKNYKHTYCICRCEPIQIPSQNGIQVTLI